MGTMSVMAQQQEQGMLHGTDASSFTSLSEQQAVASQTQATSTNAACGQVVSKRSSKSNFKS